MPAQGVRTPAANVVDAATAATAPAAGPATPRLLGRVRTLRKLRLPGWATATIGVVSLVLAVGLVARSVDGEALQSSWRAVVSQPARTAFALLAFAVAFGLRSVIWVRVLPGLRFRDAMAALHVSLGANHVLPLRLGEPIRVLSVARRTSVSIDAATASTLALRSADIIAVAIIGLVLGPKVFVDLVGPWGWAVFGVVAGVGAGGLVWLVRIRGRVAVRLPGPLVAIGSIAAWTCEALLVWQCAQFAGIDLAFRDAVLVTTAAVAAQTVAIAPSGIGTYEAASMAAYAALGFDPSLGLVAAITAHALKTVYSLVTGAAAAIWPTPSLLGRIRLPRRPHAVDVAAVPAATAVGVAADGGPAPVVLFLPAHDEEASVGAVVRRAPAAVCGHPVEVVVIDDGSRDATAQHAEAAGATVVRMGENQGLGAAVRRGLQHATSRGAIVVAFCDADGEYAPEELERLARPILDGDADYVVGSRFAGTIHSMRPHRRVGNVVLTKGLSFVARRALTDGQSGYRALSGAAASTADVAHDFNYAQVLTLDLLAKGYRYREVPISYSFRTQGRSFIRLGSYLRAVIPAVYRVVNRSVLDDVAPERFARRAPALAVEASTGS